MMRNLFTVKASLFTLILALVAFGTIAAAAVMHKKEKVAVVKSERLLQNWYFIGDEDDDPTDPNNYAEEPLDGKRCSETYEVICQIQAPDDGNGHPDMSAPAASGGGTVESQISSVDASLPSTSPVPTNSTVLAFRAD
ncbi:hypothetical protein [Sphingobacterium siyangense]|uniref:hypothetical protein n=1 Tax=Sphingobacterium siyangense TaxID=459529 RepID=UPI0019654F2F|nr:hypothetical protein [Sphingobacterium siyangense]QRY59777.1 hypothetical protein JVX97_10195 [Sphingobacterium siyangense]